jgi:hypothetical protein
MSGAIVVFKMKRPSPAGQHFELVEPWLAELDRLARRRAGNRAAIDAHLGRFDDALRDWEATTGDAPEAYRQRLRDRIGEILESPWPKSAARVGKLTYAQEQLGRGKPTSAD